MPEETRVTGNEMTLLMQMVQDVRGGVDRVERRIGEMVPRPEFTQHTEAVKRHLDGLDRKVTDVENAHEASEKQRAAEVAALNKKIWATIGGAFVTIAVGAILAFITKFI